MLEHIRQPDVLPFLKECRRVLKSGGTLRIAVPDLERLCILYIEKLQAAGNGDTEAARDYQWIMIEMFHQAVRERSGGEMLSYLRQDPIVNLQFVLDRIGEEGRQLVRLLTYQRNVISAPRADGSLMEKLLRTGRNVPRRIHRLLLTVLLGPGGMRALDIGLFRLSGEVHQWMYDRFSLSQLLLESGFETPRVCKPTESQIRGWASFNLDTLEDGTVIKPDLFYMEAIRPRQSG